MKRWLLVIVLASVALAERLWWDLGANVELVTMVMLVAAAYMGYKWSLMVVGLVMLISDLVIGNTKIFLFTWSAFLIEARVASEIFSRIKKKREGLVAWGTGVGLGSSLFFYGWTNFGVWWLDSWGMYANDMSGLIASYVNGVPFLKLNIVSTLIFVPLGFGLVEMGWWVAENRSLLNKYAGYFRFMYRSFIRD